jgi:hypothetical protein
MKKLINWLARTNNNSSYGVEKLPLYVRVRETENSITVRLFPEGCREGDFCGLGELTIELEFTVYGTWHPTIQVEFRDLGQIYTHKVAKLAKFYSYVAQALEEIQNERDITRKEEVLNIVEKVWGFAPFVHLYAGIYVPSVHKDKKRAIVYSKGSNDCRWHIWAKDDDEVAKKLIKEKRVDPEEFNWVFNMETV